MILRILLPSKIFLDESVTKIIAESPMGEFTLKPRHIDMASALAPGIMTYINENGKTIHLAVDRGLIVKRGSQVTVAANKAIRGKLGKLESDVRGMLKEMDERERSTRTAVARLEADFVRRFLEF